MSTWEELAVTLRRLSGEQSRPLRSFPGPDSAVGQAPPFSIDLAPWAVAVASELHDRFGDDVVLRVGALAYPDPFAPNRPSRIIQIGEPAPLLDGESIEITLDHLVVVSSGHDGRAQLRVKNLQATPLGIVTNGSVTAVVVDPSTGERVGGFAGAQALPRVVVRVDPQGTTSIPLLIGTASFRPELGYAVPPGQWSINVTLDLENIGKRRTPPLPITVTD